MKDGWTCPTCGKPKSHGPGVTCVDCRRSAPASDCSLNELAEEIRGVNQANGWDPVVYDDWDDKYKIPAVIALIHSEASEALEDFRRDSPIGFVEELADVLIRVLDCAGGLTDDFDSVVRHKIAKNRKRTYRHGGKRL